MNTPLSSFTALVKFKFDRAGLTDEIKKVRQQLQGLHDSHVRQKDKQAKSDKTRESSLARQLVAETRLVSLHARANRENAEFDRKRLEARNRLHTKTSDPSAHLEAYRRQQATQAKLDDKINRDKTAAALKAQRLQERVERAEQARLEAWHRKREKEEQKATRDAQARRLKELRNQDVASRAQASRENTERRLRQRVEAAEQARYQQWFQQRERDERNAHNAAERRRRVEQQAQDRATREHQRQVRQRTNEEIRQNTRRDADAQRRLRQNRPPNTQGGGSGGNTNPWHIGTMAGGLGGLISRGNLAAVGAGAFTQQSFTQANFDIAQVPQFEFITGSAEEAAKQVAFLNKEVDRLSLPLRETSNMYRQLLASTKKGLGIEKTQELFTSFSEISTMLGLSSDAQSRGLRAFAQMASKGQVMSEELKGQLSEALPGAVGIFAEALYGKDPDGEAKLFKAMEKGQVKMEELVKVIDHMKTLSREDLIKKMLDSPAKKMEKMRTAWSRLLTEINSSFMLDVFTAAFDKMADEIKKATSWMKENKEEIKLWVNRVKHIVGALWDLKEVLIALYITNKLFKAGGIAGGLWGWLTRVPVLPPAPLSVRIVNFLKSGLRMALRAWPAVAAAFIYDLVETLQGKSTILSGWIESDNGFVSALAKIPVLWAETIKNMALGGALLVELAFTDDKAATDAKIKLWKEDLMETFYKYRLLPDDWTMWLGNFDSVFQYLGYVLDTFSHNLSATSSKLKSLMGSDEPVISAREVHGYDWYQENKKTEAAKQIAQFRRNPAVMPQQFSTSTPSMLLPRQQTPTTQTFSLVINAEGTPDAIKSVATQAFADMMSSSILGVSANYQGGK